MILFVFRSGCGVGQVKCSTEEADKCGKNAQCDPETGLCICHSDSQDFPHCCYPSCNIDGKCVEGKCQCIGDGKYPRCQEACIEECKEEEQCSKVYNLHIEKGLTKSQILDII